MKIKHCLLILPIFCFSCSESVPENSNAAATADPLTEQTRVVAQNDTAATAAPEEISLVLGKSVTKKRYAPFGSEINTLSDGYGNTTEIRKFPGDELIKMAVVRTRADGSKQVLIYGQNGEVITLPADKSKTVLESSTSTIAYLAQIKPKQEEVAEVPPEPAEFSENAPAPVESGTKSEVKIEAEPVEETEKPDSPDSTDPPQPEKKD